METDANGIIIDWNQEAEHLWGWSCDEAIGKHMQELVPERNRERQRQAIEGLTGAREQTMQREITGLHKSGREFDVQITMASVVHGTIRHVVAYLHGIDPLERAAAAFGHNEKRYRMILDQIEDGCSVADLRGNLLFVNTAYCRLFGLSEEAILGTNFRAHFSPEIVELLRDVHLRLFKTGEVKAFEFDALRKGEKISVEMSLSIERDTRGEPIGSVAIVRDCTERTQIALELARAKEAAETASRFKGEFLANMSHEIRTPMNGIIGMTSLALETELTDYQADCLKTVKSSADSLLTILNDILDLSKIESGKLELEAVSFSLADVLQNAIKPLAFRAHEKGLEVICDVARETPTALVGDPTRLKQIVTNLVGNAIKFTDAGRIVVSARRLGDQGPADDGAMIQFSVSDTGIGIPADKHAAIFESFRQADGSTTRRFGGTGLGLAISSTLVQVMGGRIWVESVPGAGSTFHFTVRFALGERPETPARTPLAAPADSVNVLVAEDNMVNQRVAVGLLTRRGHRVTAVGTGREAIDALGRGAFDVVLMDIQMPDMGGFEATAEIREQELARGGHVRIIALTAHAMTGVRERCLAAGMDGYVAKPFDPLQLFAAVEQGAPA